jgi:hypothetical protein
VGNFYSGGSAYHEREPGYGWIPILPNQNSDLGFQTFVATVPEPSTFAMGAIAGLVGLAYVARKRLNRAGAHGIKGQRDRCPLA